MVGRRLAPRITDAQLAELGELLTELETNAGRQGVNRYFELNVAFHDRMVEMTGNAALLGVYRQVVNRMHLLRRRGFTLAGSSAASHAEHRAILQALAARDADAAADALRQHALNGHRRALTAHRLEESGTPTAA